MQINLEVPKPRSPVVNPLLVRPDWLKEMPRDPKLLWLDKNENSDKILLSLTRKVLSELDPTYLSTCLATYPEMAAFYQHLANSEDISPKNLLLTAGSDGVIRTVFEAFISPEDIVLHTAPTFAMYPVYCMIFGAKAVTLEYAPSERGPYLNIDTVISKLETCKPRLFCLPNPDSPTGTVFTPSEIKYLLDKTQETGTLILIDEAYFPFYSETAIQLVNQYPHLVIARTFSKAWGLAGLRTGYAVAHPELTQYLHKVRPMYEVNTMAIGFIYKMLDYKNEILASVKRINQGKAYFNQEMQKHGFKVLNGHGNFTHVAFGKLQSQIFDALANLVIYRKDFKDPCLKGYSRFSATTEDVFQQIINRITETVKNSGNVK
ncbi:histidinol-phosphate aminotransferase family protein [Candidatus Nomurabacteria bacterium]|nr:histidinol-phosphate aminotransferase family protein [Candidatus Nomurabacteria bacterium]